jgi:hypothetical protein
LRHLRDAGYVIVRSDWAIPAKDASMLFIQGGFFNRSHRQSDDFSFEWFERGRKILSDSGKYHYNADDWRSYFTSTRAHNTIEVDGLDFPSKNQKHAYGSGVKLARRTGKGVTIIMQVENQVLQVQHRRRIDYRPGQELSIKDTVRSDRPRVYVQWHHFASAFELSGDGGRFALDDGDILIDLEASTSCGRDTKYERIKGQRRPRIQGWASTDHLERHRRWALGVECKAQNATFEARYELGIHGARWVATLP